MTTSTPSDLAAALRSFPRRLREAMAPVAADPEYAGTIHVTELHDEAERIIAEVAARFGVPTEGRSLDDVVADAAREIEGRPTKDWATETLEGLQEQANHVGALIREISHHIDQGR
jgi:hypothetical protein